MHSEWVFGAMLQKCTNSPRMLCCAHSQQCNSPFLRLMDGAPKKLPSEFGQPPPYTRSMASRESWMRHC